MDPDSRHAVRRHRRASDRGVSRDADLGAAPEPRGVRAGVLLRRDHSRGGGDAAPSAGSAGGGFGSGELASISVETDGNINGFYTNGQFRSLGEVGVATFTNAEGLRETGENLWGRTANSGSIVMGKAAVGKAGNMIGGALENSNVDIAHEFTQMILAQRGYQASSRVISIEDEILAEAVNLI